jgi:hypothetical protein
VTVSAGADNIIILPSNWNSLASNTLSTNTAVGTVTVNSASLGAHDALAKWDGTGAGTAGTQTTPNLHVTWNVIDCSTPTNDPPTVDAGGDYSGDEGSEINIAGVADDPDGDPLSHAWSYTPVVADAGTTCSFGNAGNLSTTITCNDDGTFTLTLTASDGVNPDVSDTANLTVMNVLPTATFDPTANGTNPAGVKEDAGAEVTYTFSITDPGSNDTVDAVDTTCGSFGSKAGSDSFTTSTGGFNCVFPDGGVTPPGTDTTLSAAASDDDGAGFGTADTLAVNIQNVAPSIDSFVITVPSGPACQGATNTVDVSFNVTDPADDTNDPITGTVTWGDGDSTNIAGRSIGESHNYAAGTYGLTVSVNDGDGGTATAGGGGNVALLYSTSGILQPINTTGARSSFKIGSTIPVKIRVTDCLGKSVPGLTLNVMLQKLDASAIVVNETVEVSVPDVGNTMRYDSAAPQYIYNLSTKRSQLCSTAWCTTAGDLTSGTYRVTVHSSVIAPTSAEFDTR